MKIVIFDLDETVIDSSHRTPNNPDGTLNLPAYIEKHTPANVRKDKLLPLARIMRECYVSGYYVIVLTARFMHSCDYQFLARHGLNYHRLFSREQANEKHQSLSDGEYKARFIIPFLQLKQFRNASVVMFDDAAKVKTALRKHFPVLCAKRINSRIK